MLLILLFCGSTKFIVKRENCRLRVRFSTAKSIYIYIYIYTTMYLNEQMLLNSTFSQIHIFLDLSFFVQTFITTAVN